MKTTVTDLIEQLQQLDPDLEVRIAFQPQWPLRATVANVVPGESLVATTCWCGAPATHVNEATDATDEHLTCEQHLKDGYRPLPQDEEPGDVGRFAWIAVEQVSAYGENPYAPSEAWEGAA